MTIHDEISLANGTAIRPAAVTAASRRPRREARWSRSDSSWLRAGAIQISIGLLVTLLSVACNTQPKRLGPVQSAEFGVFYGGQVQQREEIPFELDRAKQTVGLRIDFGEPLRKPATVSWEIDMPGASRRVRDVNGRRGAGRLVKLDQVVVPAGQSQIDQLLPFEPGDSLGVWNIRVRVNGEIVIDRPFEVFSEGRRRRAIAEQDAGTSL